VPTSFDEIDHTALMERLRRRVGDKRVLALVKAFLKSGLLDEDGVNRDTRSGTPQGGILSPLLANLALTHLDDHFQARWAVHRSGYHRQQHRARGGATYRLVRYADDFVIMIAGRREHAEAQWVEVGEVLSELGLRLAPEKTRVVHIDGGFDFLGFHIQRHTQKGSIRRLVYSYPSKKSVASIRRNVKTVTKRITQQSADNLFLQLGRMVRGWATYFRHGASSHAFQDLQSYMWHRVWEWLKNKHPRTSGRWIIRRYYNGWWPEYNGVALYKPATMTIQRYRYRGACIPTPWTKPAAAAPA
jgi:RNA-directed DNA polymerase